MMNCGSLNFRYDIDDRYQFWEIKKDIKALFAVNHISNSHGHLSSALPDIYNLTFNSNEHDLSCKQPIGNRLKLITHLQSLGIEAWVAPVENNTVLEFCLFPEVEPATSYVEYKNNVNYNQFTDSELLFDKNPKIRTEYYPSEVFFEKSKEYTGEYSKRLLSHLSFFMDNIESIKTFQDLVKHILLESNLRDKFRI